MGDYDYQAAFWKDHIVDPSKFVGDLLHIKTKALKLFTNVHY